MAVIGTSTWTALPPARVVRAVSRAGDAIADISDFTEYLTKSVGQAAGLGEHATDAQRDHVGRLHAELQVTPCSPRCAVWLLYGIQPHGARHSMTPGRCKGKAHQPEHLGIAGRRVLVSRKWSSKTLNVSLCSTSTRIAQRRVRADQSPRRESKRRVGDWCHRRRERWHSDAAKQAAETSRSDRNPLAADLPWLLLLAVVVIVAVTWPLTDWLYGIAGDDAARRIEAIKTGLAVAAGTGGAFALLLAFRRQLATEIIATETREAQEREYEQRDRAAEASERDAEQRRITELYTKAADQLGSDKAPVRLAGLYALERVGQKNPDQRQTIVDVICAYLRMPYTPSDDQPPAEDAPAERTRYENRRQELQVRLTAQRILVAHLKPEAVDTVWTGIDLDLTGAHLHRLDLTNCHMQKAQFDEAQFDGNALFVGAQFGGYAGFDGAQFGVKVVFDGARFAGDATFTKVQFGGYAGFDGARFAGSATFNDAQFGEDEASIGAIFLDAQFGGDAKFNQARFAGGAVFDGTQFDGEAEFDGTQFDEDTMFKGVHFDGPAWFIGAQFVRAQFTGAQFSGTASFGTSDKPQFRWPVWFDGARARPTKGPDSHKWPARWTTREAAEGEEEG